MCALKRNMKQREGKEGKENTDGTKGSVCEGVCAKEKEMLEKTVCV